MGKKALLIGNGSFESFPELSSPSHNVASLKEILLHPVFGGFEVTSMLDQNADTILNAIDALYTNLSHDSVTLFYYTGHGKRIPRDHLYLIAKQTDPEHLSSTAVPVRYITDCIDRSSCKTHIIILDNCFSGAFPQGLIGAPGSTVIVLTASDSTELAWEQDENAHHSLFTANLIEALTSPLTDIDGDGFISVDELYIALFRRLKGSKQRPLKIYPFGRQEGDVPLLGTRETHLGGQSTERVQILSYSERQRVKAKYNALSEEWNIRIEKLSRFRTALARTFEEDRKFKIELDIVDEQKAVANLEDMMRELEAKM